MKICKGCGHERPLNDYYPHPAMGDGYLSFCKPCVRARQAAHKARTRAENVAITKRWREQHPEQYRVYLLNGRASRAGVAGRITMADYRAILTRDRACRICGATEDLTFDHIVALSCGGPHSRENLQILCRACNARKGNAERAPIIAPAPVRDRYLAEAQRLHATGLNLLQVARILGLKPPTVYYWFR